MPVWKFVIRKSASFRGGDEDFANRYHYQREAAWDEAGGNAALDELIAAERACHSNAVRFLGATAGPIDGETMIFREFTTIVAGSSTINAGDLHPEVCMMVEWPVDRRRTLRKFIHPCGGNPGDRDRVNAPLTALGNTYGADVRTLDSAGGAGICAPNGALATADGAPDPYLRTRQFTAGRKRNLYVLGVKTDLPPGGEIR